MYSGRSLLLAVCKYYPKKFFFVIFSDQDVRSPHKCKKLSKCIAFCHFSDQDHHTNLKRAKNQSKFCYQHKPRTAEIVECFILLLVYSSLTNVSYITVLGPVILKDG